MALSSAQQLGLEAACRRLEIDEEGADHHRALDDSRLTARIMARLLSSGRVCSYIQESNDEFYRRLNFKTRFLSDLMIPFWIRSSSAFIVSSAERSSSQKGLAHRNRAFCTAMHCPDCGKHYEARVQFKEKYEGVIVKRRLTEKRRYLEIQEKEETEHGEAQISGGV